MIRTLAIETTGHTGSIALLEDETLLLSMQLNPDLRSAQSLSVALHEALRDQGWQPQQVDLVAVAQGPGSFTGLRVGVTTAKTFAYAAEAKLVGTNTLNVIAAAVPSAATPLWCVLDAQRQQVITTKYAGGSQQFERIQDTNIQHIDSWLDELNAADRVAGPILERLCERIPPTVDVIDSQYWRPQAEWVGRLGLRQFRDGHEDDIWQFVPHYHRKSAAEEKAEKKAAEKLNSRP